MEARGQVLVSHSSEASIAADVPGTYRCVSSTFHGTTQMWGQRWHGDKPVG